MIAEVTLGIVLFLIYFYASFKYKTRYWRSKGVKQPKVHFPLGNNSDTSPDVLLQKESIHGACKRQYREFEGEKYYGTYSPFLATPVLHLRDLDLIQHVMGK